MTNIVSKIGQWWYRVRASKFNRSFGRVSEPVWTFIVRVSAGVVGIWAATEAWKAHTAIKTKTALLATSDLATWGQYGDYLGGVVGTYATIASVCLLVLTFHAQYLALEHSKQQNVRDELQRVIGSTVKTIDELLESLLPSHSAFFGHYPAITYSNEPRQLMEGVGRFCRMLREGSIASDRCGAIANESTTARLATQLSRLEWCLGQFSEHGGSPVITKFYGGQFKNPMLVVYVLYPLHFPKEAVINMGLADSLTEWDALKKSIV